MLVLMQMLMMILVLYLIHIIVPGLVLVMGIEIFWQQQYCFQGFSLKEKNS